MDKRIADILIPPVSGRYGAPMGRANVAGYENREGDWVDITVNEAAHPMHLVRVRLDAGGYDGGGAYWGHGVGGERLYGFAFSNDICGFVWAKDREAAKEAVRDIHPLARFYR
jgi:hypothetical protein